jgi:prepilin-type N-terminal cleavage/methylation domain-containing protein
LQLSQKFLQYLKKNVAISVEKSCIFFCNVVIIPEEFLMFMSQTVNGLVRLKRYRAKEIGRGFMSRGFSLVELLVVVLVLMILMAIGFSFITNYRPLFKPGEQTLQIADIFLEARQRALTQRRTMRVEINMTDNIVQLIDERNASTHQDDVVIRQLVLLSQEEVKVATPIPGVSALPPELISCPMINGCPLSVYPPSANKNVCTFRFMSNGTITDAGTNAIGANASVISGTLYIWSPRRGNPGQFEQAYALTIVGGSGFVRMWEYNQSSNSWQDSRRFGVYAN